MLDKDFFNVRIIILDGARGTMLQRYGLAEEDFHTDIIDSQAVRELKGNNECLNLSHPEIIRSMWSAVRDSHCDANPEVPKFCMDINYPDSL